MSNGLGSPWELPIKEFSMLAFLIDMFIISIPIFIPLILAEVMMKVVYDKQGR